MLRFFSSGNQTAMVSTVGDLLVTHVHRCMGQPHKVKLHKCMGTICENVVIYMCSQGLTHLAVQFCVYLFVFVCFIVNFHLGKTKCTLPCLFICLFVSKFGTLINRSLSCLFVNIGF